LVFGCWLLAEPTPEFQLSCERFPDPSWPPAVAGLLGIDPVNGILQRRVPLIPPERLRRLGVPFGSPVVALVRIGNGSVVLAESGLFLLANTGGEATGSVLWREAGLGSRASGKALRLAPDGRAVWALLWRNDAPPVLVLVDLRSGSVARTVPLGQPVEDVDLLPDGAVLLSVDVGGTTELVRRDQRSGQEQRLASLPRDATCCWIGPLASSATDRAEEKKAARAASQSSGRSR
jgi:hypothetical protein